MSNEPAVGEEALFWEPDQGGEVRPIDEALMFRVKEGGSSSASGVGDLRLPRLRRFMGLGRANAPKGENDDGAWVRAGGGVSGAVDDPLCRATSLGMPEARMRGGGAACSLEAASSLSDPDESDGERTRSECRRCCFVGTGGVL